MLALQTIGLLQIHQPRGEAEEHRNRGQQDRSAVNDDPDPGSRLAGEMFRIGEAGRDDQAQHQRQEEDAEMRCGMVAGQIKVDHHHHPGRQQQPIAIARQRRTGRFDRFHAE